MPDLEAPVLRLTDDECLAIGASHDLGWRGFVPTVALDAEQLRLAAERGMRSAWARDLYADLDDAPADHPLRLIFEVVGAKPAISAFGAAAESHLEPLGPVLNVFATGEPDVFLLDVVFPDGRHELSAASGQVVDTMIETETTRATEGSGLDPEARFVVVRREGDSQTVAVTP